MVVSHVARFVSFLGVRGRKLRAICPGDRRMGDDKEQTTANKERAADLQAVRIENNLRPLVRQRSKRYGSTIRELKKCKYYSDARVCAVGEL